MPHLMPLILEPDDRTQGGNKFFSVEVAGEHAFVKWSPAINELILRENTNMTASYSSGGLYLNSGKAAQDAPHIQFSYLQMNTTYDFSISLNYREAGSPFTYIYKLNSVRVTTLPHRKSLACFSFSL